MTWRRRARSIVPAAFLLDGCRSSFAEAANSKFSKSAEHAWAYSPVRVAACGGRQRRQEAAGLRRREAAARTAFSRPKFLYAASASALGPRLAKGTPRADAKADARSGPSRGKAAARCALAGANSKFTATRRIDSARGKLAAERTGLLSSSARLQPSARGRLRAAGPGGPILLAGISITIGGCGPLRPFGRN